MLLTARREELVKEAAAAAGGGADRHARRRHQRGRRRGDGRRRRSTSSGQVDFMMNNAAAPGTDLWIWEQTLENWNATIAIDVTAAMLCTREVLNRSMLERKSGVDPELLVDRGLERHGAQVALRHRQGVAQRVRPRRSRARSGRTASAATASCRAASIPSCCATGSRASPTSKASRYEAHRARLLQGVALRDISSTRGRRQPRAVPGLRREPDDHRAVDPRRRRRRHAGLRTRRWT